MTGVVLFINQLDSVVTFQTKTAMRPQNGRRSALLVMQCAQVTQFHCHCTPGAMNVIRRASCNINHPVPSLLLLRGQRLFIWQEHELSVTPSFLQLYPTLIAFPYGDCKLAVLLSLHVNVVL